MLLANDTGPSALSMRSVGPTTAKGGTVTGTDPYVYTPPPGFTGTDFFPYVMYDAEGEATMGIVRITVAVDNIAPTVSLASPGATVSGNVPLSRYRERQRRRCRRQVLRRRRADRTGDHVLAVQHHLEQHCGRRRQPHADRGGARRGRQHRDLERSRRDGQQRSAAAAALGALTLAGTAYRDGAGTIDPGR